MKYTSRLSGVCARHCLNRTGFPFSSSTILCNNLESFPADTPLHNRRHRCHCFSSATTTATRRRGHCTCVMCMCVHVYVRYVRVCVSWRTAARFKRPSIILLYTYTQSHARIVRYLYIKATEKRPRWYLLPNPVCWHSRGGAVLYYMLFIYSNCVLFPFPRTTHSLTHTHAHTGGAFHFIRI